MTALIPSHGRLPILVFAIAASSVLIAGCADSEPEKSQNQQGTTSVNATAQLPNPSVTSQPDKSLPPLPDVFANSDSKVTQQQFAKAMQGDHVMQFKLASVCQYLEPNGVENMSVDERAPFYPVRNEMTLKLMKMAANGGIFDAEIALGAMYESGYASADRDVKEARSWFEKALKNAKKRRSAEDIDDAQGNLDNLAADVQEAGE